jgi:hypothetical protein
MQYRSVFMIGWASLGLSLILLALWLESGTPARAGSIPSPAFLSVPKDLEDHADPMAIADVFLGMPYRYDGVLDERGRYTLFQKPQELFDTPGLNCSGFVVSVSRFLFHHNFRLEHMKRDRLGDSGPDSPLGDSWDFGWDLVFNLTDGLAPVVLGPDGRTSPPPDADGRTLTGFDLGDEKAWRKVMDQMRPDRVYLGSFSKPASKTGAGLLHYHVALFLKDVKGAVWMYQTTHNHARLYRLRMDTSEGMGRFLESFANNRIGRKNILLLEVARPDGDLGEPDEGEGSEGAPENLGAEEENLGGEAPPETAPEP